MSDGDQLLNIRDLAERWGVSIHTAKQHVRRKGVPFFQVGTKADMLVNWNTARFRLSAILRWEQESERVFAEPAKAEPRRAAGRAVKHFKIG